MATPGMTASLELQPCSSAQWQSHASKYPKPAVSNTMVARGNRETRSAELVNFGTEKMKAKQTAVRNVSTIVGGTNSHSQAVESKCVGTLRAIIGQKMHDASAQKRNPVKYFDIARTAA